jgi:hypothetical protein
LPELAVPEKIGKKTSLWGFGKPIIEVERDKEVK